MPTYSQTNLQDAIWDPNMDSNISSVINVQNVMNEIVRDVLLELDMRSTKRRAATSPNLFDNVFDYAAPSDMKRLGLIDLVPQIGRGRDDYWTLTTPEEFDRMKGETKLVVAISDYDFLRKIRVSVDNNAEQLIIASLDTITGDGGTWVAYDSDTDDVETDSDDFVKGSGSVRFDINAAGGTTAGIKNTGLTAFDYSEYVEQNRSAFVWAKIASTTNLTNYKLRIGDDLTANYDEITVTQTNEAAAFRAGWNLLRFDFVNKTTTGSPARTASTAAALFMTKAAGKISEAGYKFDHLIAQQGKYYDVLYYSKYGWQNSSGTYLENSTASTDSLNADVEEFNIFVQKGRERRFMMEKDFDSADREEKKYDKMVALYKLQYPSDALILKTTYQEI